MAPHAEQYSPDSIGSNRVNRRLVSAFWETIEPAAWRNSPIAERMARTWHSSKTIAARSSSALDGGQIAGAVVGSVLGGTLILLVAGFLYFRYRRKQLRLKDDLLPTKAPVAHRRVSFPGQGYLPGQPESSQRDRPRSFKDGSFDRDVPIGGDGNEFHQSPTSATGSAFVGDNNEFYTHLPSQQADFTHEYDLSSPRRSSAPFSDAQITTSSLDHVVTAPGASNDYYNASVAMESDPEQPSMAPPTRQMTELYQEQLRLSREKRKSSKGSAFSRVLNTFKRKRSSHASDLAFEPSTETASPGLREADVPLDSVEGPSQPARQWTAGVDPTAPMSSLYAEPQEISDGVDSDNRQQKKKSRRHGQSQDTLSAVPHRLDSLRTALQSEPTPDPQLPSAALGRSSGSPAALFGQQGPDFQSRENYRLKSPDIPSPMNVGASGFTNDIDASALRGSHSPPLAPETFVDPMAIMNPTTDTEKAAFHQTAWERWNSASPPRDSVTPAYIPEAPEDHQGYEGGEDDDMDEEMDDEDDEEEEEEEGPESDTEMANPAIAEPGQYEIPYDGPSDYSTPPGQSSSNPSSGRTPDTRITPSPSPLANDFIKPESSASPQALSVAIPVKSGLTCEECGRTFDQIHKLNHHKRYHDRKHACTFDGCDKKFGTKTHLDRHINDKHEKKKGFHCTEPSCPYFHGGKAFPRKDNWRRHMQNKHGLSPPSGSELVSGFVG